jgi:transposase-like protein
MTSGKESADGWRITWENIPVGLRKRIKALVCDGYPNLVHLAKREKLLVQRCHFHLIASIKNYVTAGPLNRSGSLGQLVLNATQIAINTPDEHKLESALEEIWMLIKIAKSKKLKARLRGLLRDIDDFRTYRTYPELNLPTTSNTAESLVQYVRDLMYKARGFRTADSFMRWVKALCLVKKTMICNGKNQPIKYF